MTRRPLLGALAALALVPLGAAADPGADEQTLRDAGVATDGRGLLLFFRQRTLREADRDKIAAMIARLGDDSFDEREKASCELLALGGRAEPQLREAAERGRDAEIKRRAEDCLRQLSKQSDPAVLAAAARLLGERKPAGAAEVLLAYLPQASDEAVHEELVAGLAAVAVTDGKADGAVVRALDDTTDLRRAAAAVALCRAGAREQFPAVRKLLRDRDATVRLRVAVALALAREKEAVPALIDLLADLPERRAIEAEDLLFAVAGDGAPNVSVGKADAERKKCRDAWAAWWRKNADNVDLAKLADGTELGLTLLVQRDTKKPTEGRVMEVGRDGGVRWQIEGLHHPTDAHLLPGGRVLICEYATNRLSERRVKDGEIVWQKALEKGLVIGAQRLANGNTFVVTRTILLELDRDGKEVWNYRPTAGSIYAARKSRTGEVAVVNIAGTCTRLDANGKEIASFAVGRMLLYGGIDLLPNGNVLVPNCSVGKVIEYDAKGKAVWEVAAQGATSAVRLPNGHTLIASAVTQRVVEVDRDGKEVWKCNTEGRAYKAYRR
jgi:hypothetical protein